MYWIHKTAVQGCIKSPNPPPKSKHFGKLFKRRGKKKKKGGKGGRTEKNLR